MFFNLKNKKEKGFTIIELIVVIAIIAVLAAIVLTNVQAYVGKSKIARAESEAVAIYKAYMVFVSQYGVWPTDTDSPGGDSVFMNPANALPMWLEDYGDHQVIHRLSEFWPGGTNATYFDPKATYWVYFWTTPGSSEIDCGSVEVKDYDSHGEIPELYYGGKCVYINSEACATACQAFPGFSSQPI